MKRLERRLEKIYDAIPPLANCNMCGKCCVNVNMTMIEYIHMFKGLTQRYSENDLIAIMNQPMIDNLYVTNNKCCRFLSNNGHCLAYLERAYSCRAGGNASLDAIYTKNCFHQGSHKEKSPFTLTEYWETLLRLERMDDVLRGFKSNLFISRLSLESWTSLYLMENIKNEEVKAIQDILRKEVDLNFLKGKFKDIVNFSDKIDAVTKGKDAIENNDYGRSLKYFKKIIDSNFDGYYYDEAFYYSGICCEKLGRDLDAINNYLRVSKFHPFYKSAMNNIQNISTRLSQTHANQQIHAITG